MKTAGLFTLLADIWGVSFVAIKARLLYFSPVLFAAPVVAAVAELIVLRRTVNFLLGIGCLLIFGGFVLLKWTAIHEELTNTWRAEVDG